MNKIILGVNALLVIAVGYLFFRVTGNNDNSEDLGAKQDTVSVQIKKPEEIIKKNIPATGKIAFVDIEKLNDESQFVDYMMKKLTASRKNIEASLENLGMQYEKKMQEYQASASAGIAPKSELAAKEKEIQNIEREAQNKQIQMDNLARELNEKNEQFQDDVRRIIKDNYADKFDYVLTFSKSIPSMLYGSDSFDITDEVIELLNSEFQSKKPGKK